MLKKLISAACVTTLLGFSVPAMAQVGDLAKQAGKATVETTKNAGKKTTEGIEKATSGTKKGITGAPQGATGKCKDGTYTMAKTKSGACSKHGGIETWY